MNQSELEKGNGARARGAPIVDVMHSRRAAEPLREVTGSVLRAALLADVRVSQGDGQVRLLMQRACDDARAKGVHVEQLIVLLKESWHEIPQTALMSHGDGEAVLGRMVSLCIDEYYAPRRPF
jgi:hypothetical protein